MQWIKGNRGQVVAVLIGLLNLGVLGGCEHPASETRDYQREHRLKAEERVFSLAVNATSDEQHFEGHDEFNIRRFVKEYMRRGRGPFLITSAGKNDLVSKRRFEKIAAVVAEEGVPGDQIYFQLRRGGDGDSNTMRLSFSGYFVRLPECGDWSGETGFAPSNQPHSDFGCSYQRNFGLMLANPGDLKTSRASSDSSASRTDYVIGSYRNGGKAIGRPRPVLEDTDFSSVK